MTEKKDGKEKTTALTKTVQVSDIMSLEEGAVTPARVAELWADGLQMLLQRAIAATKSSDWIDEGGRPYPTAGAVSTLMQFFRCKESNKTATRIEGRNEETGEPYFIWEIEGQLSSPLITSDPEAAVVTETGMASSADKFFFKKTDDGQYVRRVHGAQLEMDVKRKAITNWRSRAVRKLLLGNMTWEDLAVYGIQKGKGGEVKFGKSKSGGGRRAASAEPSRRSRSASTPHQRRPASTTRQGGVPPTAPPVTEPPAAPPPTPPDVQQVINKPFEQASPAEREAVWRAAVGLEATNQQVLGLLMELGYAPEAGAEQNLTKGLQQVYDEACSIVRGEQPLSANMLLAEVLHKAG